jgi:acetyl-CoA/propionyl-CoA carboxylase biotin carboxyl carrier protein
VSATESVDLRVVGEPGAASVSVGGGPAVSAGLAPVEGRAGAFSVDYDGETRVFAIEQSGAHIHIGADGFSLELRHRSRAEQLAEHLEAPGRVPGAVSPDVRSPMPGTVIAVHAATGDTVTAGQTILVVEAMKMEHKLVAATAGRVTVNLKTGDLVALDQIVATVTITDKEDPE